MKRSWLKRGNSVLKRSYLKRSGFKKRRTKTERQVLIDGLDKLFRECLLLRDKVCQYSGKKENLQVSHYITRENKHLRWDFWNCHIINGGVHLFLFHKRPHLYKEWLIRRIGKEKVEWLEMQDRIYCKPIYTCDLLLLKSDLLSKLEYYKKRDISNDKVEKLIQLIKNS